MRALDAAAAYVKRHAKLRRVYRLEEVEAAFEQGDMHFHLDEVRERDGYYARIDRYPLL